jgi:predicted SAM-dependent methyltransferase
MLHPIIKSSKDFLSHAFSTKKIQHRLRGKLLTLYESGNPIRVVIGSAGTDYPGWIMTDLPVLNALRYTNWRFFFKPRTISTILAEHVVEHWDEQEFRQFLSVARKFLSPKGFIRIAVPDGFHPDRNYIDAVKPGGTGSGADDHKILYNFESMSATLSAEGYDYKLLEYFDNSGGFHSQPWENEDGPIERSAEHDPRNVITPLTYTSLIIDTWPQNQHG